MLVVVSAESLALFTCVLLFLFFSLVAVLFLLCFVVAVGLCCTTLQSHVGAGDFIVN